MNVLVVDDESIARRVAAHTLQQAGYEVTTAQDGREALEILARGQHRLVVSDWKMPRMDGVELCRTIRSGQFAHYIYFIMLTGQTRPEETIEGLERRRRRLHLQAVQPGRVDPPREHRPADHRPGNARHDDLRPGQAGRIARPGNRRTPGTRAELLPRDRPAPSEQPALPPPGG